MDSLATAITSTVKDQHPVSDFINNNTAVHENAPPPATEAQQPKSGEKLKGKRRPGRPFGSAKKKNPPIKQQSTVWTGEGEPPPGNPMLDDDGAAAEAVQRKNAALGATMLIQTSGMMLAGSDGKMGPEEFTSVSETFDRYFLEKGIKDFPPGVALALALGGYYIRLAATDNARPKLYSFSQWVKKKFNSLFKRNKKQEAKETEEKAE